MSETPRQPVRFGFVLSLIVAFGLFFVVGNLLPTLAGSRKAKLPQIISNLKQIDVAKQIWASDHQATNGTAVSDRDLLEYFRLPAGSTGLVRSVDSEVYVPNPIGTPPQARLERAFGSRFPKGTLVRWSTNAGLELLLPNPQGEANGWQLLYPSTN